MSGYAGGLNGSTQHLLEAHAQGFQQLRVLRAALIQTEHHSG